MESRWYKRGVTLIEMMIVISIIALLVSIALVGAEVVDRHGKEQVTRGNFLLVEVALEDYHEFGGSYPVTADPNPIVNSEYLYGELHGIADSRKILANLSGSLVQDKNNNGKPELYDGWGTVLDYSYVAGQTFPELISAGPDRTFGTPDDISSKRQ